MESLTAKLCAFARAWHSSHSDHTVFNDFLALDFMGQEEYEKVSNFILKRFPQESENSVEFFNRKYFLPIVLSRSRFAEDRVKLESQSGKIQYVICGAGVDTFSFRNKNPNVEVFELDLLATQSYKKNRIRELHWNIAKNVHFVAIWAFHIICRYPYLQKRFVSSRKSQQQEFRSSLTICKRERLRLQFCN